MEKVKNLVRFFLGVPLTLLAFGFIGKLIFDNRAELFSNLNHIEPFGILVGIIFFNLFFFFRSLLWKAVLNQEGYHPSTMESTYLLATSELKRYIPGSVLAIVGRVNSFNVYKIPSKAILRMVLYESVLFFLASVVVSIPAAIFLILHKQVGVKIVLGIFIIVIVAFAISFFVVKKRVVKILLESPKYIKAFLLSCCAWIFFGIGNYLILSSFYSLDPTHIAAIVSFFTLSWLVGYVIAIAPMGLGVREGFLTYELSFFVPIGAAAALSVLARITFVICEIIFVGLTYLIYKVWRPRPKIEATDAILWGMIFSYVVYFVFLRSHEFSNYFSLILLVTQTVIIAFGSLFIYELCYKLISDKSLSLVFVASYLLNPIIQKANLSAFNVSFFISEAAIMGLYAVIVVLIEKILESKIKPFDLRFFCILVLFLSVAITYLFGILPGAAHPYILYLKK